MDRSRLRPSVVFWGLFPSVSPLTDGAMVIGVPITWLMHGAWQLSHSPASVVEEHANLPDPQGTLALYLPGDPWVISFEVLAGHGGDTGYVHSMPLSSLVVIHWMWVMDNSPPMDSAYAAICRLMGISVKLMPMGAS